MSKDSLIVNEIFLSIQGEGSHQGIPCFFIRLTGCNLRCTYCDTKYAYYDGTELTIDDILDKWKESRIELVQITGGEPLLQKNTIKLINKLLSFRAKVLLETNGSFLLKDVPHEVIKIVDVKTPGSGMLHSFNVENLRYITRKDELKFVVTSELDMEWTRDFIKKYHLETWTNVLISPEHGMKDKKAFAEFLLAHKLRARFQLQLHKLIWNNEREGIKIT